LKLLYKILFKRALVNHALSLIHSHHITKHFAVYPITSKYFAFGRLH
jgi:hypothetical protein